MTLVFLAVTLGPSLWPIPVPCPSILYQTTLGNTHLGDCVEPGGQADPNSPTSHLQSEYRHPVGSTGYRLFYPLHAQVIISRNRKLLKALQNIHGPKKTTVGLNTQKWINKIKINQCLLKFLWSAALTFTNCQIYIHKNIITKLISLLWRTDMRFLKKLKIELPYDPTISFLGIRPEKKHGLKGYMHATVHFSTVYNSQDTEAT